jgi:hypothetical protein
LHCTSFASLRTSLASRQRDFVSLESNLVALACDLGSRRNNLGSCCTDLASRSTDLASRCTDLVSHCGDLASFESELPVHENDLVGAIGNAMAVRETLFSMRPAILRQSLGFHDEHSGDRRQLNDFEPSIYYSVTDREMLTSDFRTPLAAIALVNALDNLNGTVGPYVTELLQDVTGRTAAGLLGPAVLAMCTLARSTQFTVKRRAPAV